MVSAVVGAAGAQQVRRRVTGVAPAQPAALDDRQERRHEQPLRQPRAQDRVRLAQASAGRSQSNVRASTKKRTIAAVAATSRPLPLTSPTSSPSAAARQRPDPEHVAAAGRRPAGSSTTDLVVGQPRRALGHEPRRHRPRHPPLALVVERVGDRRGRDERERADSQSQAAGREAGLARRRGGMTPTPAGRAPRSARARPSSPSTGSPVCAARAAAPVEGSAASAGPSWAASGRLSWAASVGPSSRPAARSAPGARDLAERRGGGLEPHQPRRPPRPTARAACSAIAAPRTSSRSSERAGLLRRAVEQLLVAGAALLAVQ